MQRFDAVVQDIYGAAAGSLDWQDALSSLCRQLDSFGAVIISQSRRGELLASSHSMLPISENYAAGGWHQLDEWYRGVPLMRSRGAAADHEFMTQDEVSRSQFYQDFVIPNGMRNWAGFAIPASDGHWCLSLLRTEEQQAFDAEARDDILRLVPHLAKAIDIHTTLKAGQCKHALDVLYALGIAAVAVSAAGKVIAMNDTAAHFIGDDLAITGGRLCPKDERAAARFELMLHDAASVPSAARAGPHYITLERQQGRPLVVSTLPFPLGSGAGKVAAFVLINDPEERIPDRARMLRQLFRLTSTEAEVGSLLADGHSIGDISEALQISEATARQYAKQIFAKSDTHKQGEFVSLVHRMLRHVRRGTPAPE